MQSRSLNDGPQYVKLLLSVIFQKKENIFCSVCEFYRDKEPDRDTVIR